MGKEDQINHSANIARALEKAGFKLTPVTIIFDPKIDRAVKNYVMRIEEAHKKAANGNLHFDSSLASALRI